MNTPDTSKPASSTRPTITVVGQGQTSAAPDSLVFRIHLKETRSIAYDAELALKDRRKAVREALESIGVDPRDLRSEGGAAVFPDYRYTRDSFEFIGFQAKEDILLRAPLGTICQTDVLTVLTPVSGNSYIRITHELSDPEPIRLRALAAAVEDARKKATIIAEAAGATLGDLVRLSHPPGKEGGQRVLSESMSGSDDFSPEDQFEEAEVEAIWALRFE